MSEVSSGSEKRSRMAVPRQRKTKSSTRQRRSHHALKRLVLARCKNCGEPTMPHQICKNCGYYRGRQIISVKVPKTEALKK